MRVASRQLVAHRVGNRRQVKSIFLVTQFRVKDDLKEKVPQFLLHVGDVLVTLVPLTLESHEILECVEYLVGLFEEVSRQGGVGLLLVPRALAAQSAHEVDEVVHRRSRRAQSLDPHRRQVVNGIEVDQFAGRHLDDDLIGQSEVVQHGHH